MKYFVLRKGKQMIHNSESAMKSNAAMHARLGYVLDESPAALMFLLKKGLLDEERAKILVEGGHIEVVSDDVVKEAEEVVEDETEEVVEEVVEEVEPKRNRSTKKKKQEANT